MGGLILEYLTPLNLLKLFSIVFSKIWSWLNFNVLISVWLVIILCIIILLVLRFRNVLIKSFGKEEQREEEQREPEWWNYKEDIFFDKLITWEYRRNSLGEVLINDLQQICKECECELSEDDLWSLKLRRDIVYCPNCEKKYDAISNQEYEDIEKLIRHKIKTGEYKDSPYYEKNKKQFIMPRYRRKKGSDTWHWCTNCSFWPTSDYDEVTTSGRPSSGELCNECKAKDRERTCRKL